MDSISDLLALPADPDCQSDRNYNYPTFSPSCDLQTWRKQTYWKNINEYHYDNIPRIKLLISDIDLRIAKYVKSTNASLRARPLEAQKRRYQTQLQELEDGWRNIAPVLRAESEKLFALPREIRERIYGYLYTRPHVEGKYFEIGHPDIDVRYSMLPRDPFLYLHGNIINPVIAAEAAQVLYDTNRFRAIMYNTDEFFIHFLRTDHFGSGVIPQDIIRRFNINMSVAMDRYGEGLTHDVFEKLAQTERAPRHVLKAVLAMPQLRRLHLQIPYFDHHPARARGMSPMIKHMMKRGVRVELDCESMGEYPWGKDLQKAFEEPSELERAQAAKEGLPDAWDEYGDGKRAVPGLAQWRTYLSDHYMVWKALEERRLVAGAQTE